MNLKKKQKISRERGKQYSKVGIYFVCLAILRLVARRWSDINLSLQQGLYSRALIIIPGRHSGDRTISMRKASKQHSRSWILIRGRSLYLSGEARSFLFAATHRAGPTKVKARYRLVPLKCLLLQGWHARSRLQGVTCNTSAATFHPLIICLPRALRERPNEAL